MLKSNLCHYILVKGDIAVVGYYGTQATFKNCAPFIECITKVDGTIIEDAEDLDLVMLMYNLLEYSSNYSDTTGSLRFCSKDEATNFNACVENNNVYKSFEYKAKILGNTVAQPAPNQANRILKNTTIAVPLKYLRNLWNSLEIQLIDCKVELKPRWTK